MDRDGFWGLIEEARSASDQSASKLHEALIARLLDLGNEEIESFDDHYQDLDVSLYSWEVWAVAYLARGGCSDDSFTDFRAYVISKGRDFCDLAVRDTDSLSRVVEPEEGGGGLTYEEFGYVYLMACERAGIEPRPRSMPWPSEPAGRYWDEEEVAQLYPELAERAGW